MGGGPGGAYTASVLAREGVEVVLLESEVLVNMLEQGNCGHESLQKPCSIGVSSIPHRREPASIVTIFLAIHRP